MSVRIVIALLLFLIFASCPARSTEYLWCHDADQVLFDFEPATGVLAVSHRATMYNCCPDPVWWDVVQEEGVITITENVGVEMPCDCICCFDFGVEVGAVPAGEWTVVFAWLNEEDHLWHQESTQLSVAGAEVDSSDVRTLEVVGRTQSPCLSTAAVPDPPVDAPSWCGVKACYR